jgi:hypothetical protein
MASAKGEFNQCETIYLPYLKKYVRCKSSVCQLILYLVLGKRRLTCEIADEDYCQQCTTDFAAGKRHIDIWTGSSTGSGGRQQINCEDSLTPSADITVVRNPAKDYAVDAVKLYLKVRSEDGSGVNFGGRRLINYWHRGMRIDAGLIISTPMLRLVTTALRKGRLLSGFEKGRRMLIFLRVAF